MGILYLAHMYISNFKSVHSIRVFTVKMHPTLRQWKSRNHISQPDRSINSSWRLQSQ